MGEAFAAAGQMTGSCQGGIGSTRRLCVVFRFFFLVFFFSNSRLLQSKLIELLLPWHPHPLPPSIVWPSVVPILLCRAR